VAEPPDNSTLTHSGNLLHPTGEGIVIDIGTGDGTFVYQCARQNPNKFYIGIDANPRPLAKISEKVHRKPTKGGLANVLFLQAAVEDLPSELTGIADEIHVHFPWGTLLRGVAIGDTQVLNNLRRLCAPGALLEVILGLDWERDKSELERLGVSAFSIEYIDSVLAARYLQAGFEIFERGEKPPSDWPELYSSWARRLKGKSTRPLTYLIARAVSACDS
jgi:16S rRNA (adenine(1408)-N(1))-methyltransferase